MHILLVENEANFSRRWSRFWEHLGHTVALATTYAEAVEQFEIKEPNLIVCDNDLDDCDAYPDGLDAGYYFIIRIREEGFFGRVILYTANRREYFERELGLEGLDVRFIRKRHQK